ncbi:helix-turn-helix transcriptional regulator [Geofilum sp. OHC36d9]|uniref:helix-turn-helix transcriptional regulator n=1 Tax=Geofilum sp. OHC36d9 TaxID=3458413 RepID=UPI004033E7BA
MTTIDTQLALADSLMEESPSKAMELLNEVDLTDLDPQNQSYYNLLYVIASDKLFYSFDNDSVINSVVDYYSRIPITENYIRALYYKAMVRFQMGESDSLVYDMLKEVENLIIEHPNIVRPELVVKVYFYLGRINEDNSQYELTVYYYQKARGMAQSSGYMDGFFASSIALAQFYSDGKDFEAAQQILLRLDTIGHLPKYLVYDLVNSWGAYYANTDQNDKALRSYLKMEVLSDSVGAQRKMWLSSLYHTISKIYKQNNVEDSALIYAKKSVQAITDSSFQMRNYTYFKNLADLSLDKGLFKDAAMNYREAYRWLSDNLDKEKEKRILELEKKYDLTRATVESLKQKQRFQLTIVFSVFILLNLLFWVYYYRQRLYRNRLALENERLLRKTSDQALIHQQEKIQQNQHLLVIYQLLAQKHTGVQAFMEKFAQRFIKDERSIFEDITNELSILNREFSSSLLQTINDSLFINYIKLPSADFLTNAEKAVLFLCLLQVPSAQIVSLLNISTNNLRVRKSAVRRKLASIADKNPEIESLLETL